MATDWCGTMSVRWRRTIGRWVYYLWLAPSGRYELCRTMPDDADDVVARGRLYGEMSASEVLAYVIEELREIADEMEKTIELP